MLPIIDKTNPSIAYHTNAGADTLPAKRAIKVIPPTIDVFDTQCLELAAFFIKPKLARNSPIELITPTPTNRGRKNEPTPPNKTLLGVHPDCKPIKREYATYRYAKDPRKARMKPKAPFPDCLFADFAIYFTYIK